MFNVVQNDWGIGDVICTLYAIKGLASKYPEQRINLFIRQHFAWALLAEIPQMKVHRYTDHKTINNPIYLYDVDDDPLKIIKHTNSPKKLFASKLNVEPIKPELKRSVIYPNPIFENYIVLAPFATRLNRTWELANWKTIAQEFHHLGYRVIVLAGPFEEKRCKEIGVDYYLGASAAWTANVCLGAKLIIGNDSGIAHLGGWLGTKTLVLMSQLLPEQFYDLTDNQFIIPQEKCTSCRFLPEHGYERACDTRCWVLQTIQPKEVLGRSLDLLKEKRNFSYSTN